MKKQGQESEAKLKDLFKATPIAGLAGCIQFWDPVWWGDFMGISDDGEVGDLWEGAIMIITSYSISFVYIYI